MGCSLFVGGRSCGVCAGGGLRVYHGDRSGSVRWVTDGGQNLVVSYAYEDMSLQFAIGKNLRIAPWGNRTGHPYGRFPHYHRRKFDKKVEWLLMVVKIGIDCGSQRICLGIKDFEYTK